MFVAPLPIVLESCPVESHARAFAFPGTAYLNGGGRSGGELPAVASLAGSGVHRPGRARSSDSSSGKQRGEAWGRSCKSTLGHAALNRSTCAAQPPKLLPTATGVYVSVCTLVSLHPALTAQAVSCHLTHAHAERRRFAPLHLRTVGPAWTGAHLAATPCAAVRPHKQVMPHMGAVHAGVMRLPRPARKASDLPWGSPTGYQGDRSLGARVWTLALGSRVVLGCSGPERLREHPSPAALGRRRT